MIALATRKFQRDECIFEIIASNNWIQKYNIQHSHHPLYKRFCHLYDHFKRKVYTAADQTSCSIRLETLQDTKICKASKDSLYDFGVETFLFVNSTATNLSLRLLSSGDEVEDKFVEILPGEPIAFVSGTHFSLSATHRQRALSPEHACFPLPRFKDIVYIGEIVKYPNLQGSAAQILYEFLYGNDGPWRDFFIFLEVEKRTDPEGQLSALYMKRGFVPTHLFYNASLVSQYPAMKDVGDFLKAAYEKQFLSYKKGGKLISYLEKEKDNPQTTNHLFVLFPLPDYNRVVEADRSFPTPWVMQQQQQSSSSESPSGMLPVIETPDALHSTGPREELLLHPNGLFSGSQSKKKKARKTDTTVKIANDNMSAASRKTKLLEHAINKTKIQEYFLQQDRYFMDASNPYQSTFQFLQSNLDKAWTVDQCICEVYHGASDPIEYTIQVSGFGRSSAFPLKEFLENYCLQRKLLLTIAKFHEVHRWQLGGDSRFSDPTLNTLRQLFQGSAQTVLDESQKFPFTLGLDFALKMIQF